MVGKTGGWTPVLLFQHAVNHFSEFAFRSQPNHGLAWFVAALENEDTRDTGDAELGGHVRGVIHVELADLDLASELIRQAVDGRPQLPAGTAPGCPEIDEHRLVALFHFLLPVLTGE